MIGVNTPINRFKGKSRMEKGSKKTTASEYQGGNVENNPQTPKEREKKELYYNRV